MSKSRRILVTGATGKQGGALISALLSNPSQPFQIEALTRNKTSSSAQQLAQNPNVNIVQGDFNDVPAIFSQIQAPLWGIFIVTTPLKGAQLEEDQGLALVQAAVEAKVAHIVFTATDRGGQIKSDTEPTKIPHFISKYNIEREIVRHASTESSDQGNAASPSPLSYTFLRPVAFFENLTPEFFGKGFAAMWRLNGLDRKLQMISTADIGHIAAEAFLHAEEPEYRNRAISLAGDEISPAEAATIFTEVTGKEIPSTFAFVGWGLRVLLKDQLGLMFDWFKTDGFGVDVPGLKGRYPFLKDFRTWLRTESAWKKENAT